ncbi:MAG: hypothetical protein ACK4PI_14410 [Tepidisphaerales bacterium]
MRPPLKLSAIDQEHLQELYDEIGISRDELPYTEAFDRLCDGFQARTFKNAEKEQIYVALCKHVRSSTVVTKAPADDDLGLTPEQLAELKKLLPKHCRGGKLLPYSDEFENCRREFVKLLGQNIDDPRFWKAVCRVQGVKRVAPPRRRAVSTRADDGDDE